MHITLYISLLYILILYNDVFNLILNKLFRHIATGFYFMKDIPQHENE